MRVKKIRQPLIMKAGVEVRTLKEFRENFDAGKFLEYYKDGTLLKWLETWHYANEAVRLRELNKDAKDLRGLYEIFGVEYVGSTPEEILWWTERLNHLKKFTSDEKILAKADCVAFNQDDLLDILEEGEVKEIYLCGAVFTFSSGMLNFENKHYHGVGNVTVNIETQLSIDLDALGITFDNVNFGEGFSQIKNSQHIESTKKQSVDEVKQNLFSADNFYYGINGYPQDKKKARELYEKAARLGNFEAQQQLAYLFNVSLNTWKSPTVDDPKKILLEADNFFYGLNGYPVDQKTARKLYEKAAKAGNITAQNRLNTKYYGK